MMIDAISCLMLLDVAMIVALIFSVVVVRRPDDDLLRDVEVEDVELDCQRCLLYNSMLCTCC